jgi:hypothetical protein
VLVEALWDSQLRTAMTTHARAVQRGGGRRDPDRQPCQIGYRLRGCDVLFAWPRWRWPEAVLTDTLSAAQRKQDFLAGLAQGLDGDHLNFAITKLTTRETVSAATGSFTRAAANMCLSQPALTIAMVRSGLGVAVLPSTAIEPGFYPEVRSRPIEDRSLVRQICVLMRKNAILQPAAESFLELLADEFRGRQA